MIIYIFMFIISLFFICLGLYNKKNKILRFIFISIGLLIPCVLAGLRDITLGSDTKGYVIELYNLAKNYDSFIEYFNKCSIVYNINDFLYILVTFFSAKIFNNFNVFLFIIECLVIIPIFIALKYNKKSNINIVFGMYIFFMFFFNVSFNMLRQSIALSFSILGLTLLEKKQKKYLPWLFLAIAVGFHVTALIMIFSYLIYYFLKNKKISFRIKIIIEIIIALLSIIFVLDYTTLINFLSEVHVYEHGIVYLDKYAKLDFSFIDTALYFFILMMIVLNRKDIEKNYGNYKFYKFITIESLIILQLGSFIQYAERVSFYLIYPVIFNILPLLVSKDYKYNKINKLLLISIFAVYWILVFGILGMHDTVPYVITNDFLK